MLSEIGAVVTVCRFPLKFCELHAAMPEKKFATVGLEGSVHVTVAVAVEF